MKPKSLAIPENSSLHYQPALAYCVEELVSRSAKILHKREVARKVTSHLTRRQMSLIMGLLSQQTQFRDQVKTKIANSAEPMPIQYDSLASRCKRGSKLGIQEAEQETDSFAQSQGEGIRSKRVSKGKQRKQHKGKSIFQRFQEIVFKEVDDRPNPIDKEWNTYMEEQRVKQLEVQAKCRLRAQLQREKARVIKSMNIVTNAKLKKARLLSRNRSVLQKSHLQFRLEEAKVVRETKVPEVVSARVKKSQPEQARTDPQDIIGSVFDYSASHVVIPNPAKVTLRRVYKKST